MNSINKISLAPLWRLGTVIPPVWTAHGWCNVKHEMQGHGTWCIAREVARVSREFEQFIYMI
jgi:hypothetical protein